MTFGPVDSDSADADHIAFEVVVGSNGFRVAAYDVFGGAGGGIADTSEEPRAAPAG